MQATTYDDYYRLQFGAEPPASIIHGTSNAELFSEGRGFMGEFDLTMQIQVGCPGGCHFCYVPSGPFFAPKAVRGPNGSTWGYVIRDKEEVVAKLNRNLRDGNLRNKTIYWSGATDPYASKPVVSRAVWEALLAAPWDLRPRRIAVQTRYMAGRDAEVMAAYSASSRPADGGPAVVISYSIGTDRNDLIRAWERATPSFEQRVATVEQLRRADLSVVVTMSPMALWNDLRAAAARFRALNVAYLTCLFFKENARGATTPKRFLNIVRQQFPMLLDPTWQQGQVKILRDVFGEHRVLVGQSGFASLANPQSVISSE